MLLQKKALILSTENDMQRGHYDVEQRHKTAIKQLQYRYKKNFGRCNNLTMRLWANSGSSPVRTARNKSLWFIVNQRLFYFNPRGRDSVENDLRLPKNETFQVKDGMKVMRL